MKRLTREEIFEEARAILAREDLDEHGKQVNLEGLIDDLVWEDPDVDALKAKEAAIEEAHTGTADRPTYCPTCSTWAPEEPRELMSVVEALSKAFRRAFLEVVASIRAGGGPGKAA